MIKIFLILFTLKKSICENIEIPLGIINTKNVTDNISLITKLFYYKPYLNISIGTPSQLIPILFCKDSFSLFIHESNFNKNKSSTYNSSTNEAIPYFLEFYFTGYPSKDIINFGNFHQKIFFDFVLSVFYDNPYGCLGMKIPRENRDEPPSFPSLLKNSKIIHDKIWTIKINKNLEYNNIQLNNFGELIIGDYPHQYEENKNKYNETKYKFEDVPIHSYKFYWDIKIKCIYLKTNDKKEKIYIKNLNTRENEVSLKYENMLIIGTQEYHNLIYENFFDKYDYIKNNICIEKIIPEKKFLNYIECIYDEKKLKFNLSNFPSVYFESIEYDKIFELNSEDLFLLDKKNNKYIFLIIFPTNYIEITWGLGFPFLKKYQFIFDEDKKLIGYYNSPENYDNSKIIENENNEKYRLYILIIVLLLIVLLLLVITFFLVKKLMNKNRRKRANELDDEYEYNNKYSINDEASDAGKENENKSFDKLIN